MTNVFLSRTNHVGSPWLSRSEVSGWAKQSSRSRSSGDSAMWLLPHRPCRDQVSGCIGVGPVDCHVDPRGAFELCRSRAHRFVGEDDERRLPDVDSKEVERLRGLPSCRFEDSGAVPRPETLVLSREGPARELEIPFVAILRRHGAVNYTAGIAGKVEHFPRLPHPAETKLPVEERELHWRDPRVPVFAQRPEQHHLCGFEPLPSQRGQRRGFRCELMPARHLYPPRYARRLSTTLRHQSNAPRCSSYLGICNAWPTCSVQLASSLLSAMMSLTLTP